MAPTGSDRPPRKLVSPRNAPVLGPAPDPSDLAAVRRYVDRATRARAHGQARTVVELMIQRRPRDGDWRLKWFEIMKAMHRQEEDAAERFAALRSELETRVRQDPANPMAYFDLAIAHLELTPHFTIPDEDFETAIALLKNMITVDPDELWGYWGLRRAYAKRSVATSAHRYEDAIRVAAEAVRRAPKSARAHFELGTACAEHYGADRKHEALDHYTRGLVLDPTDAEARFFKASLLRTFGRWDEAIAEYTQVMHQVPDTQLALDSERCLRHLEQAKHEK